MIELVEAIGTPSSERAFEAVREAGFGGVFHSLTMEPFERSVLSCFDHLWNFR